MFLKKPVIGLAIILMFVICGVVGGRELPRSFSSASLSSSEVELRVLPEVDHRLLIQEAAEVGGGQFGQPLVYAEPIPVQISIEDAGDWQTLDDGSRVWRLRIQSPGAQNLNLHFSRFALPAGAELWIYNGAGDHVQGPYSAADRNAQGELWTALVYGEEIVLELDLPVGVTEPPVLELAAVNHGFRGFELKQGGCNNDVVCPEGDPFRDQAQSVVRLSIGGSRFCTGQLMNNTANDDRPLLLTAFHCILNDAGEPNFDLVPSTVAYFNFQSPTCGALSGGQLNQSVSGAVFRAGHQGTDFLLAELNQAPPADFEVYLAGWNASGETPSGAVGIHHPSADEKAISFDQDPLSTDTEFFDNTHWRVGGWEDGTTEPGSSGSCIFDPADGLCVGTLTGGFATCLPDPGDRTEDYYGKLSAAWEGGGTADSRLRDWLDPVALGVDRLEGKAPEVEDPPANPPSDGDCVPNATTLCLLNGRFEVEVSFRDFEGQTGFAQVSPLTTAESGLFYFFDESNLELLVKVINGCGGPSGHFWVFAAGTTNLEYSLVVTDTETGIFRSYDNPLGVASPAITDTRALDACP